ncbi:MAG: hypothetical protein LQ350_008086 [Teloschistes chrysophthalmus]|nr:MAG: hypothetical protein LQ350_008086 [Niorma chrysophthalma]
MADDDVATKAPESDAQESLVAGDTPAQDGPSMGDHCITDRPTPAGGAPTGEISKIADVDVYITKPSDYPHLPSKLLLLLSSGTGIHSKNNQLQADKYASEGFVVVMPDQFAGDPAPNTATDPNAASEENPSIIEKVKMGFADTAKSFMIDMWLARQTPEKVLPLLHKVIEGAKDEFADAVANGDGIYAVGYCFGGKYVLLLGSELPDTVAKGQALKDEEKGVVKSGPQIRAGAIAHGTMITKEDIEGLKAPVTMACTENDQLFPDDVRAEGQKYLVDKEIPHEIQVFPGVPHGFAVIGEYDDATIKDAQKAAFEQMLSWLKSH